MAHRQSFQGIRIDPANDIGRMSGMETFVREQWDGHQGLDRPGLACVESPARPRSSQAFCHNKRPISLARLRRTENDLVTVGRYRQMVQPRNPVNGVCSMKSKRVIVSSLAVVLAFLAMLMPRSAPSISSMVSPQHSASQSSGTPDSYTATRPIWETHKKDVTYTVMKPVRENREKKVSYTVMTVVRENQTKIDPVTGNEMTYTVARHVPTQREKTIKYVVTNMVPEQHQKTIEYQTVRFETAQVPR